MGRSSNLVQLLVLPLVVATVGFSTISQARENHCDHSSGKAVGTIVGGLLGAGLGALVDHGHTTGVLVGAGGGAIAGRVIGDSSDDRRDIEDCGADAQSYQRQVRRDEDAQDRADNRRDVRDSEIREDIDRSRYERDGYDRGGYDRGGYDRGDRYGRRSPRRMSYACESLGYSRWGQRFGVVYLPRQRVIENFAGDLYSCQQRAADLNRWGR